MAANWRERVLMEERWEKKKEGRSEQLSDHQLTPVDIAVQLKRESWRINDDRNA